jgi:peptide/nickel transport system permease protein
MNDQNYTVLLKDRQRVSEIVDENDQNHVWFSNLRRIFWDRPTSTFGLILIILVLIFASFPHAIATTDPNKINLVDYLRPPNGEYLMGTDYLGRDIFSRVVYGSRITLIVSISSSFLSAIIGTILGLLSGYFGGTVDKFVLVLVDFGMAIPTLFLALIIVAVLGPGLVNLILAIGISGLPRYISLVRPQAIQLSEVEYVIAAHSMGATPVRIMSRHILPNLMSSLIVLTSNRVAQAILTESTLNFLGVGVQPPTATWGNMIAEGRTYLGAAPWYPIFPGLLIMITVLGFNLIGDGLRDALDPKLKHER